MAQIIVSPDGSVTLPKSIAEQAGFVAGVALDVSHQIGGIVINIPKNTYPADISFFGITAMSIEELAGSLKSPFDRPVTIEEMEQEAMKGAVARYKRSFEE